MRNIKLVLEYDGTEYCGYQIQKNDPTIQEQLEGALQEITGQHHRPICAGRTDSGVHALGQVVNFTTESSIPTAKFVPALNSTLPHDIRVKRSEEVGRDFHAQLDATAKVYKYTVLNDRIGSVFLRRYTYHFRRPLVVEPMQQAGGYLVGRHDFSSFRAQGCTAKDPEKEIFQLDCWRGNNNLLHILVKGSGFLYNMVRIIVGTLIETGLYKRKPQEVRGLLVARDRRQAGPTAPPTGLCLMRVDYGDNIEGGKCTG